MNTPVAKNQDDLFSEPLEIDDEELQAARRERGDKVLDISDDLRLLAKQNRLTLFKNKAGRRRSAGGAWLAESELQFQSLAHHGCRFMQVTLTVSLEFTPGARVLTVQPAEGKLHSVKVTESHKPSLEADIPGIGIKATLGGEQTLEQTLEQRVLSAYNGGNLAIWAFTAPSSGYELSLNVPLRLTVEYPGNADRLRAMVEVRADVGVRGWADYIPLIRRKTGEGQTPLYLDE